MSHSDHDHSRRRFLRAGLLGAAAVPLTAVVGRQAQAQDMPKLKESDPSAKVLNYVHDAADAGSARGEGEICANCQLFTDNGDWGPCSAFPGKLVNRDGWCSAYMAAS